jgi:hypothetical protein
MRKLITLLAGLALFLCTQAQTNPIKHMDVYLKPIQTDTASYCSPQMLIDLTDTISITDIVVKLGTTDGGSDIISKTFTYNTEGQFNDGTAYIRDNAIIRLELGIYLPISTCYASARIKFSNGTFSSPVTFTIQN